MNESIESKFFRNGLTVIFIITLIFEGANRGATVDSINFAKLFAGIFIFHVANYGLRAYFDRFTNKG